MAKAARAMTSKGAETSPVSIPVALTVAGSDSGGGAGIQADLKTFAALGVHGTSALTCLTAQSPREVRRIHAVPASMVDEQMAAVLAEWSPVAVKTGMLYSASIIRSVADACHRYAPRGLVVDPVMVATSGARLLKESALEALCRRLLPLATLVTPNLEEAGVLVGRAVETWEAAREASRIIRQRFGCAVLIKGGHRRGETMARDLFFDGRREEILEARYLAGVSTHGSGCILASAVTAALAQGRPLEEAVQQGKHWVTQAIERRQRVGRHTVLNPLG